METPQKESTEINFPLKACYDAFFDGKGLSSIAKSTLESVSLVNGPTDGRVCHAVFLMFLEGHLTSLREFVVWVNSDGRPIPHREVWTKTVLLGLDSYMRLGFPNGDIEGNRHIVDVKIEEFKYLYNPVFGILEMFDIGPRYLKFFDVRDEGNQGLRNLLTRDVAKYFNIDVDCISQSLVAFSNQVEPFGLCIMTNVDKDTSVNFHSGAIFIKIEDGIYCSDPEWHQEKNAPFMGFISTVLSLNLKDAIHLLRPFSDIPESARQTL